MDPRYQQAMIQALMNSNGGNKPTPEQVNTAANPMMNQFIAGAPAMPQQNYNSAQSGLSPFSPQPLSQQAAIGRGY